MGSNTSGAYVLKFHGRESSLEAEEWSVDAGMEYVLPYSGDILWQRSDPDLAPVERSAAVPESDLAPQVVGRFQGYVIQATRALNEGVDIVDHCDAHSQDLFEYASRFYEAEGLLKHSLEDDFEPSGDGQDLLIIDEVALAPAHRGRRVGLLTVRRLIQLLGTGCGFATTIPFPLQFQDTPPSITAQHPERNRQRAEAQLVRHLERLGFQRLPDSVMYAVSMAFELPTLTGVSLVQEQEDRRPAKRPPTRLGVARQAPGKVLPFVRREESALDKPGL